MRILIGLLIIINSTGCFGQNAKADTAMKSLMVYGEDFIFSIIEPSGWTGDIDIAKKYSANIVFYISKAAIENGGTLVQAYSFSKHDENTIEDLKYDIASYKKDYPNLKEKDFEVQHKNYKTFSKLIYDDNNFFQYITYINPGNKYKKGVSVAMNISKRAGTDKELSAYRQIVNSIIVLK